MRQIAFCALAVACGGSATVDGPGMRVQSADCPTTRTVSTDTTTTTSDPTLTAASYQPIFRWYDQTGEAVTVGPELMVWHDGALWSLAIESGDAVPPPQIGQVYYESVDCSGDGYVYLPLPMHAYANGEEIVMRPPDIAASSVEYRSAWNGASCDRVDGTRSYAVPYDVLEVLSGSRPGFPGPLYPAP